MDITIPAEKAKRKYFRLLSSMLVKTDSRFLDKMIRRRITVTTKSLDKKVIVSSRNTPGV